ncbi:hypothetical protein LAWI1_G006503 [Lachnellula willkommii]|uniref:C2H2-type domain-containing protein n=1 Tax=Lachnellula willkommii TaxID=215461 RepID=A0A559MCJ8_9HELO|nr:hypothetical protein LAWI1_G006503 [Lachnellula willkommii]
MELTPQSNRSPGSPFHQYNSTPQPLYEYPSPAQSDSPYKSTESLQGLGLYSCTMSGASDVETSPVVPSSTATNTWPTTTLQHRNEPRSSQSTPNALSAEYDPFAPFHPAVSAAYGHDIYSTQTAEPTALPASPAPSGNTSQRSSFSSTPASEVFTQAGSIHSYTPRIKMEDHTDYVNTNESMIMNSPQISHLVTSNSPYPGSLDATFYQDQHSPMGWPKIEYSGPQDLPSISSLPIPPYDRRSESRERSGSGSQGPRRGPSTIARTRQPRKLTTKEDANFQCHVKGCGKLFGRSYNFKAHMETHDASREYPFPCLLKDCNKNEIIDAITVAGISQGKIRSEDTWRMAVQSASTLKQLISDLKATAMVTKGPRGFLLAFLSCRQDRRRTAPRITLPRQEVLQASVHMTVPSRQHQDPT